MNYNNMSLEELLKINDENGDLYYSIGRKYYDVKSYNLAINNLKKSLTYYENPDSLALLVNIYYSVLDKSITGVNDTNVQASMLEYMDRYNKICWDKIIWQFDLWNGLFGFDRDYTKSRNDAIFLRYLFLGAIDKPEEVKNSISALEIIADKGYCNAYFYLGRLYEVGEYVDRDVEKSIKYYSEAHKYGMTHATGRLSVLYEEKGETEKAYKYAFDSATNYRGTKYKYVMTKSLLDEMKKDKNCCYGPMLFLAEIFSGDYTELSYKVDIDLKMAKELFSLSDEYSEGVHKKYYARFVLTHPELVSNKELKDLIKDCYEDLPFAYACERAIEFGLKNEAETIFNSVLEWNEYYPVYDLFEAFPERRNEIAPVLKNLTKAKITYPVWYPRISKHREEIRLKEEKKAEEKRLKAEVEKQKRKEAAEKKEKELEIKRAEAKQKSEDEYAKLMSLLKDNKVSELVSLMERNKGYLSKKFPVEYVIFKCMNKQDCPKFEVNMYNTIYRGDTTDKDREWLNKLIDVDARIKKHIESGSKEMDHKLKEAIIVLKRTAKYYSCLSELRNIVKIYIDCNFKEEDKKNYCVMLALLDPGMYNFNVCAVWFDEKYRELIYKIGDCYGSFDCRYNLLALEYRKLGLFKKKEKEEIIKKMKSIASFHNPAYLWLKKRKVSVEERDISNIALNTLKKTKKYFVDLDV